MNSEKMRKIRAELEMTQEEVSEIIGCTRSAYSLWEINVNTIPLYYLNELSNKFNINIDYLVDLSDDIDSSFDKNDIDRKKLGERIRIARKSINFTQEKLALRLNTTRSVISAYESGKTAVPTLFLVEIAKITKKSLNWFLNKI